MVQASVATTPFSRVHQFVESEWEDLYLRCWYWLAWRQAIFQARRGVVVLPKVTQVGDECSLTGHWRKGLWTEKGDLGIMMRIFDSYCWCLVSTPENTSWSCQCLHWRQPSFIHPLIVCLPQNIYLLVILNISKSIPPQGLILNASKIAAKPSCDLKHKLFSYTTIKGCQKARW